MSKNEGLTFVELLVTLVVIGVGMGAFTYLQSRLNLATSYAGAQYEAISLATSKLDAWRAMPYSAIPTELKQSDSTNSSQTIFTRTWRVREFKQPTYKVIDIKVSWNAPNGKAHAITVATAIAKTSQANGRF